MSALPIMLATRHRHDTEDPLVVELIDAKGPIDLGNGPAVTMTMTDDATGTVKVNRQPCTILQTGIGDAAVKKGQVQYDWQPADVDTAGTFRIQWELVFPSGKRLTWPSTADYARQAILADLDNV